jgi:hypothetical protein
MEWFQQEEAFRKRAERDREKVWSTIGLEIGGREIEVPIWHPEMSREETENAARDRLEVGLSPFATEEELRGEQGTNNYMNPLQFYQQGTDSVPAMLTPHEAVLNVGAADILGRDRIRMLNAMGQRRMYQQGTEDANMANPLEYYQLGTSDVWGAPIDDPNDPRLRDIPLNEPTLPTTIAPTTAAVTEPAPAFKKREIGRERDTWSPSELTNLPLSAYTPGRGDPEMEGGFKTATPGAPMYTYEMWKRGEAPYVTAAITGPGARPQPGSLVYRQIGNEIVPTRPTDRGPGAPGDPYKYDIAYEDPAYATNYPYQGQTGAYGYGGLTERYTAPTSYAARGGGYSPMTEPAFSQAAETSKPEGFDVAGFGKSLGKLGASLADEGEALVKQGGATGWALLNSGWGNPYVNQDPLAFVRAFMQFGGGG